MSGMQYSIVSEREVKTTTFIDVIKLPREFG